MHAVNLTGPWRSRRAGYGIKEVPGVSQGLNDSGLSRARWSGNDEENSVPAEFHFSNEKRRNIAFQAVRPAGLQPAEN